MKTNEFKRFHPLVNLIYFVFATGFSMVFMHPVCLIISLFSSFLYSIILNGKKAIKTNLLYMLPIMLLTALINPLFSHEGVTVIAYFPNGNPLTFESIIYGIGSALMLISVICHFSCYNAVMTSDKFIYLFGRITPALSLIISMTLRFVPRFAFQLKAVANAQKCMGRDYSKGNIIKRAKYGLNILSVTVTHALENSLDTSDSMKARGYGLKKRSAYSNFRFNKKDLITLCFIIFLGVYVLTGGVLKQMYFTYYPSVKWGELTTYSVSVFVCYLLLLLTPVIIEIKEAIKWISLKSKI